MKNLSKRNKFTINIMKQDQASLKEKSISTVTKVNCKWEMKFNVTIYSREEKYFSV